jgi:hypothetical protein
MYHGLGYHMFHQSATAEEDWTGMANSDSITLQNDALVMPTSNAERNPQAHQPRLLQNPNVGIVAADQRRNSMPAYRLKPAKHQLILPRDL